MSKKQQLRAFMSRQRIEQAQPVAPAPVVKQDDKLGLAKTKVAHLISEIVGVAETHKEFLEAANFCRRFNQAALNYHAAMNFEAAVASDGTKAPRKVDVYWQGNVIASWEPGDHRNGYQVQAPAAAEPAPEPEAEEEEEEEEVITPPPAPVPQPEPEPVIPPATNPENPIIPPAQPAAEQQEEQDEPKEDGGQPEKTAEQLAAEEEVKRAEGGEQQ